MIKLTSLKIGAFVVYTLIMYSYAYSVGYDNGTRHEVNNAANKKLEQSIAEDDTYKKLGINPRDGYAIAKLEEVNILLVHEHPFENRGASRCDMAVINQVIVNIEKRKGSSASAGCVTQVYR